MPAPQKHKKTARFSTSGNTFHILEDMAEDQRDQLSGTHKEQTKSDTGSQHGS